MLKIGMVSLGCDKNRVDAENMLFSASQSGYKIVQNSAEADVIIVNTCAFIESAKKESIETILEYINIKNQCGAKLIVSGCLTERYVDELKEELTEVDYFLGINSYHKLSDILSRIKEEKENTNGISKEDADTRVKSLPTVILDKSYTPYTKGRVITTPIHYAYLKIADGCNNCCSYCAIPKIRGRYRSEPMEKLLAEADSLIKDGVKELIIVAQDTTRYGIDIYKEYKLIELLSNLCKKDFSVIRLMYVYPELVTEELLQFIISEPKMAKYLDVPLQHIDNGILKSMKRRIDEDGCRKLIKKIKSLPIEISIRSSFIVGFPGETEEAFLKLQAFLAEGEISFGGVFPYSREENTLSYNMLPLISAKTKRARVKALELTMQNVIIENNKKYIGTVLKVIYEGIDFKRQMFYGRATFQAPDIDTKIYFNSAKPLDIGNYYDIIINRTDFHIFGELKV